ncbi:MAG: hypothetical protein GWO11_04800, partial [Desulfuromonadales bacterium]|nr:hypothetical protein [Desulfuromonadales bacterium]NIR33729.1 hypothetical protein [Desulfuromonadales bacterium]NIS39880.1 hypothetical protein [Desulfuromonadales bacterium]
MRAFLVSISLVLLGAPVLAQTALIGSGEVFPRQFLEMPRSEQDRRYLGLKEAGSFLLEEIDAAVVMVEILNVHCPHCQRQALSYNELFELIDADPSTRGRVKMLGVAAGNNWREVATFRDIYEVDFPVVPDPQFRLHRAIGQSRTPFTIFVRQRQTGRGGIVAGTHLGVDSRYRAIHGRLRRIMETSPAVLAQNAGESRVSATAAPIMSGE